MRTRWRCLVKVACAHDADDRPKDFFLGNAHLRLDKIKDRGLDEMAVGSSHVAARQQLRPFALADADIFEVGFQLGLAHGRPHLHAALQAIAHLQAARRVAQHRLGKVVGNALFDNHPAGGGAGLAGQAKAAHDRQLDGQVEIGVFQHHQRVLAAHLQLHARQVLDGLLIDAGADAVRTGEADAVDALAGDQSRRPLAARSPVMKFSTPVGKPCLDQGLDQQLPICGRKEGGLEDNRVAIGQGRGHLPGRDGNREVPRRDQRHDAQRPRGGCRAVRR